MKARDIIQSLEKIQKSSILTDDLGLGTKQQLISELRKIINFLEKHRKDETIEGLKEIQIAMDILNSDLNKKILDLIEITVQVSLICDFEVTDEDYGLIENINEQIDIVLENLNVISTQINNIKEALSIVFKRENDLN